MAAGRSRKSGRARTRVKSKSAKARTVASASGRNRRGKAAKPRVGSPPARPTPRTPKARARAKARRPLPEAVRVESILAERGFEQLPTATAIPIAKTRWLTASGSVGGGGRTRKGTKKKSRAGWGAVERELRSVREIQDKALKRAAKLDRPPAFTFSAKVRLRGPDGKRITTDPKRYMLPLPSDVKRRKGESLHSAYKNAVRALVMESVREEVETIYERRFDTNPRRLMEEHEGTEQEMTYEQARRELKRRREQQDVQIQIEIERVVT